MSSFPRIAARVPALFTALAVASGCGSTDPSLSNPAGRYMLVGCVLGASSAITPSTGCEIATSGVKRWSPSSYVELRPDGSAVRYTQATYTFSPTVPPPGGGTVNEAETLTGQWSSASGVVTATWQGTFPPSQYERRGRDTLRDNHLYNELWYFWYVKAP
jgi:hypothetical protein